MKKMYRLCTAVVSACVVLSAAASGQTPAPAAGPTGSSQRPTEFDVVTIRPIAPGQRSSHPYQSIQTLPDGVQFAGQTLQDMLLYAYGYQTVRFDGQVTGLPDWATKQRYDADGKIGPAELAEFQKLSKKEQEQWRQAMTQSMLAERFHLALHRGSKEIPVYELVVAKGGIKMKDATTDPNPPLSKGEDGKPPSAGIRFLEKTAIVQAYSMDSLAGLLSMPAASVGRPVVDKTELTGTYDFAFDWSIYSARAAAAPPDSPDAGSVPTIFSALGELGLKLEPAKANYQTLVIDHVEQPTEN